MAGRYKLTNPLAVARSEQRLDELTVKASDTEQLEDDDAAATTESDDFAIQGRPILVPSKDTEVMQAVGLRRQYLRDTGVSGQLNKLTSTLLQSNTLPYNPYPGYIKRLSNISERFHTHRKTLAEVQDQVSQSLTFVTGNGILCGVKLPNVKLWGLQHILLTVNPYTLSSIRDIVKTSIIDSGKLSQKMKNVSMMSSLKGPCVFFGSLYDTCFRVNMVATVLVTAKELVDAGSRFGESVVADLMFIFKETDHKLLSLEIPTSNGEVLTQKTWLMDDIEIALTSDSSSSAKHELIKAIGHAGLKKQDCTLNLMLNCGKEAISLKMKHIRATRVYNLLTLLRQDTANSKSAAGLYSSTLPYQAMHEGVFIEQAEAELYISTFKKYSASKSPLQSNLVQMVQKAWQEKIAYRQLESDITVIAHYQWLIERMQSQAKPIRSKTEDSITIELCRISQCLGVRLEHIASLTSVMYDIITSNLGESCSDLLSDIVIQYKEFLLEFFDEKSRDLTVSFAKSRLLIVLREIEIANSNREFEKMKSSLNFSKGYLKALSIILVDNALDGMKNVKKNLTQISTALQVEFGRDLQTDLSPDKYRHKSETEGYIDIERKVVDMSLSSAGIPVVTHVAPQAARLQYCMDVRIDEVWKNFLYDCFIVRENPPPNPYPSLISNMREASLKVQLFREDIATTTRKFLSSKPKLYESNTQLYTVSGLSAFGTFGAVACINSIGFRQVSTIALSTTISSPPSGSGTQSIAAGMHSIKCMMTISGECLLFHSASPFLTFVQTEEHCFIKGPAGQESDGALAFANILLVYFGNLKVKGILPTRALFQDLELELHDLDSVSARFQNQMTLAPQQQITVHLLVPSDWRWILVKKTIHMYYIDEMTDEVKFDSRSGESLPFWQVFLNGSDAVEYVKRVKTLKVKPVTLLKKSISEMHGKCEWSELSLLTVALSVHKGDISALERNDMDLALFAWRLYHSSYGNLAYSAALNEALTECVLYVGDLLVNGSKLNRLVTMLFGYRNCLNMILTSQNALSSTATNLYCQNLLQNCAPCNLRTGTAAVNKELFAATLIHILSLTTALCDSLVVDVIRCTPALKSVIKD